MPNQLSNISKNSALLVMDFQTIILNNFLPHESAGNVIRNTASLIAAARQAYRSFMSASDSARVSRGQQEQHYLRFD